ncbi:MFS general substrate transporter [Westerdykella ornata]|uniref:MFS general substrate transporter n=1 Tax=Westerdykella ornata TaxID=318751 RepID=A0A6A6JSI2_WESOR|nr:MFS general substrate transporter [Westerdykella ornata]KAF2277939.1 MFS general substrate transporter [Westerdykella ornata]
MADTREDVKKKSEEAQITEVSTNTTATTASNQSGDEGRTLWQNVKKYRKVVWITLAMTSAILLYGYDYVIVGTVSAMPRFQEDFGQKLDGKWILPSNWLALWNVSSPLGAMFGSVAGGWFQDRVGRRIGLGVTSFLSALSVAVMYVSYIPSSIDGRRACFLAGKLFQGAAIGGVMTAAQTYMSETLPPVLRGSGMALFPVFTLLGQLVGALVIYGALSKRNGYSIAFGSQWPFSLMPIVVSVLIPESPAFYVRKRRIDDALKAQARLDPPGTNTRAVIDKLIIDIDYETRTAGKITASYALCFRPSTPNNLRRTLIVMWANALPSVFGLQLLAKASYFLQVVGMDADVSIVFLILGIVLGLLANGVSVWLVSRVGRRKLIVGGLLGVGGLWAGMGVANSLKVSEGVVWTAASMMLTILVAGLTVWPSSFAVAAETSALHLRAKTQGIGWTVSALSTAITGIALPYIFNPDQGNLRGKTGYTYVGACLLGAGVSWYVVPEMKGRSVEEIDGCFERGLRAWEFEGYDRVERGRGGREGKDVEEGLRGLEARVVVG